MFYGIIIWAVLTYFANRPERPIFAPTPDGIHNLGTKKFNVKNNVWTEIK